MVRRNRGKKNREREWENKNERKRSSIKKMIRGGFEEEKRKKRVKNEDGEDVEGIFKENIKEKRSRNIMSDGRIKKIGKEIEEKKEKRELKCEVKVCDVWRMKEKEYGKKDGKKRKDWKFWNKGGMDVRNKNEEKEGWKSEEKKDIG